MKYKFAFDKMFNNIGGHIKSKTYFRSIQNPKNTPWLDWIIQGIKTYEGRLNKGEFSNLNINDIIFFVDKKTNKQIKTIVTNLKYYDNFEDAFNNLGEKLVPVKNITSSEVKKLYSRYFTDDDIQKYGVVAIGISVIE